MRNLEEFGGEWTEQKLTTLQKYLRAYVTIFTRNPWARRYRIVYVDAFAGAGYIRKAQKGEVESQFLPAFASEETNQFIEGSARRALELDPGFNDYLFIEQDQARCEQLRELTREFPTKNVRLENAEANGLLKRWCEKTDWTKTRAVVFLDPYGMDVEWSTVESIASTQAIDLWYLFPLGAVLRLLSEAQPPASWAEKLTHLLGTADWKTKFYLITKGETLFGPEQTTQRQVDPGAVGQFFIERLSAIFAKVAPSSLLLRNSRNVPLFSLCFAAGNPRGAPTAVRIANDLIRGMAWPPSQKSSGRR